MIGFGVTFTSLPLFMERLAFGGAGLPVAGEAANRQATETAAPRRRLLRAYVEDDGWA